MNLRPTFITEARRFVGLHHRHNLPPKSALFALGVEHDGELVGVALVGRPVAQKLADGYTAEVTRVCVLEGYPNACSMLYGAAARAAKALGYRRVITYTLDTEPGTSLRAVGWTPTPATTGATQTWDVPSRPRLQQDLFGNDRRPLGTKVRWTRELGRQCDIARRDSTTDVATEGAPA